VRVGKQDGFKKSVSFGISVGMKILVADHQPVVRHGLKQILAGEFKKAQVCEAANAADFLEKVRRQKWDLVILDVALPGGTWMDLIRKVQDSRPGLPVLIFSMHGDHRFAMRAIKAGAAGYVTKESAPEELTKAAHRVVAGGQYVSPAFAEKLVLDLDFGGGKAPHETLSDREYQVMCMIAAGKTPKEIASELSLSIKTISTYRGRVLQKTKLKSNADLIRYAIENRLDGTSQPSD
jgi:DNA-binding NarL/FixJ family response regulator